MSEELKNLKIFISYSSHYRYVAEKISTLLTPEYKVRWDRDLIPSTRWAIDLIEWVKWCNVFVYLLTPESIQSIYCSEEFNTAARGSKMLLPLLLRNDIKLPKIINAGEVDIPGTIKRIQSINFTSTKSEQDLLDTLAKIKISRAFRQKHSLSPSDVFSVFDFSYQNADIANEIAKLLRKIYIFCSVETSKNTIEEIERLQSQINSLVFMFQGDPFVEPLKSLIHNTQDIGLRARRQDIEGIKVALRLAFENLTTLAWK